MKFPTTLLALAACACASVFAQDATPPQVVSTASLDRVSIGLLFNEAVDPTTATDASKYSVNGGATVDAAELLGDGRTVRLGVTGLTGTSYNLTVTGVTDLAGNGVTSTTAGQVLDFTAQDLGDVAAPGVAAAIAPGSVDVYARGSDIWGFADSGHFVWKEKTGDFDVRVRLDSFTAPSISANAGLMARETADAGSRNVSVVTYANQRIWVGTERAETDGNSRVLAGSWSVDWPTNAAYPNIWMRLKRSGNTFTTYGSTNGLDWVQVGDSVTPATAYPATLLVGMRTTPVEVQVAGSTGIAKYREYGDYAITTGTINIVEQPANATVRENATATFSVRADTTGAPASNLSYQWQKDGVDIPGATSATYTTSPVSLTANGAKYRVRLTLPGGTITKLSNEATLSVVQDNTAPAIVSSSSLDGNTIGIRFDELLNAGTAADTSKYSVAGGTVNGATLGADGMTVTLNVSGLTGSTYSLTVNGVTDLVGNAANITSNGQILGFTVQDLGTVPEPGSAISTAPGSVDVSARGLDIWGAADSGQFVWKDQTGDFDVRVRVESFQAPAPDANAGLMARETADAGSRNVSVVVYANQKNWTATQRVDTDGASSVLAGDWRINWPEGVTYPNVWVRLKRAGNTFTTYGSTNGVDWTQIGQPVTPANPYPQTLLLGLRTTPVEVEVAGSSAVAKYRDYGSFAINGASVNILTQPTSVAVTENRSATFSVSAEAVGTSSNNLTYQWQRDGVDIDGAISPTFTLSSATTADNNAKLRVKVSLPGGVSVLSQEATLTVNEDVVAPKIVSGGGLGSTIGLVFDEKVDANTANDATKYTVSGATVVAAELQPDAKTVVLTLDAAPASNFTVSVSGVADIENNAATTTFSGRLSNMTFSDIGIVPEPSRGFATGDDSFTVYARGTDIWGFADSGNFIWEERTGDFDVKVQLASYVAPAPSANAGLMARESLAEGSRNIQIVTYANQAQWVSAQRAETDGNSSVTPGDWDVAWPAGTAYPNVWMRLKRVGNTFTVYGGTNGVDWIQVGDAVTPATPYPDTILVGMRTTPVEVQVAGTAGVAQYLNYGDVTTTGGTPTLTVQQSGNQLTISWPTAEGAGFALETTNAIGSPWTAVTTAPTVEGATTKVTVAINTSGNQFFRLKR